MPCPNEQTLGALIRGELPGESADDALHHVEGCDSCRERLDRVRGQSQADAFAATHFGPSARTSEPRRKMGRAPEPERNAAPAASTHLERPARPDDGDQSKVETQGSGPASAVATRHGGEKTPPDRAGDRPAMKRGMALGRYLVLQRLGAGGMGEVYLAYDPQLDRRVALKLLRDDVFDGDYAAEGRNRLLREAQAMARLSHPNVVAVHDVGTVANQVFVAMEFIDGCTLKEWVRKEPRSWRDVVGVLVHAGRGLVAAHAAGLVHRDFKPDNVLVGKDGKVFVSDFGLARPSTLAAAQSPVPQVPSADAISEGSGISLLGVELTRAGAIVGTPAYMAPEQHRGEVADARTDQFCFCVTAWEALYGKRPFDGNTMGELANAIAAARFTAPKEDTHVPPRFARVLQRGLSFAADMRYPSMEELLVELERDPAAARRRWISAGVAAVVVAVVVPGYIHAQRARERPCREAAPQMEAIWSPDRKQELRSAFLATGKSYADGAWRSVERVLDGYSAGWVAMATEACEATHVRRVQSEELHEMKAVCLDRRFHAMKALLEVFTRADAQVLERSADAARALPVLEECADVEALAARVKPPADGTVRRQVDQVRQTLDRAKALHDAGKYAEGLEVAGPAAVAAAAVHYRPVEAEALARLGELKERSGDFKGAEGTLTDAIVAAEAGRDEETLARAWILLVNVVGYGQARYELGHQHARHAAAILEGMRHVERVEADFENIMSNLSHAEGKYDEALAHDRRALAIREKTLGPDHPLVATSLNNLGIDNAKVGNLDLAFADYRRAISIYEAALGPDHPRLAEPLVNLANALRKRGDYEGALAPYQRALKLQEGALGTDHPVLATTLNNLADLYITRKQDDKALPLLERALAIQEKTLGPDHPQLIFICYNLGTVAHDQGRHDAALAMFQRAVAICDKRLRPGDTLRAATAAQVGHEHLDLGAPAKAIAPLERALGFAAWRKEEPGDFARAEFDLARALWEDGRERERARKLATQARDDYRGTRSGEEQKSQLAQVDAWLERIR